ncbi:hypothetical protein ABKN59_010571 [Abortiporus biennis]
MAPRTEDLGFIIFLDPELDFCLHDIARGYDACTYTVESDAYDHGSNLAPMRSYRMFRHAHSGNRAIDPPTNLKRDIHFKSSSTDSQLGSITNPSSMYSFSLLSTNMYNLKEGDKSRSRCQGITTVYYNIDRDTSRMRPNMIKPKKVRFGRQS